MPKSGMRILFDHSTPRPLRGYIAGYDVDELVEIVCEEIWGIE